MLLLHELQFFSIEKNTHSRYRIEREREVDLAMAGLRGFLGVRET